MSNPNVEFFCILLVVILLLDYNNKIRIKSSRNRLGFNYLSGSILLLSSFLLLGDLFQINHLMSFQWIKSLLVLLPSIIIYFTIYNNITKNKHRKGSLIFTTVFIIFYIFMSVLYSLEMYNQVSLFNYSSNYEIIYLAIVPLLVLAFNFSCQIKDSKNIFLLILVTVIPIAFIILDLQLDKFVFITAGYTLSLLIIYIDRINLSLNIDPLTKVYNRYYFEKVIRGFKLKLKYLAVYYIDIDRFKQINDQFGHGEGDNVLKIVARILEEAIDYNAEVYRVGGDEFVILRHLSTKEEAEDQIDKINLYLEEYKCDHYQYDLSLSIGYEITDRTDKLERIIQKADEKMYKVKKTIH